ncbi:unnamed protein product [Xylocopa violacea]|uniref:Uncharacterized protein n=1 Tax=Xylocopa violacea TaxID=135666 RepID=A0ABP1NHJ8_XYLVO
MQKIVLVGIIAAVFGATFARDLPDFLHVCKRNDPNLGECIKNSVENFKPYLKQGLAEYKIPSLEPLLLKEVASNTGGSLKLKLSNVKVSGASNFTLNTVKASLQKLRFIINLNIPSLTIKSDYNVDGKIILLQIRGTGPLDGHFYDCKGVVRLQMEMTKGKDGQDYLKVSDLSTKFTVGGGSLKLQNLFGGDQALGDAVNMAINSNLDAFMQELTPTLEAAISDTFTQIANGILPEYSYDVLFPTS